MQEVGVVVDLLAVRRIDLEVADEVAEHVSEQDDAGDGHHHFLAEGRFVEPDGAMQLAGCRDGTHVDFSGGGERTFQYNRVRDASRGEGSAGHATQKWRCVKNSKKAARSLRTRTAGRSVSHAGRGETRFPAADCLGRRGFVDFVRPGRLASGSFLSAFIGVHRRPVSGFDFRVRPEEGISGRR